MLRKNTRVNTRKRKATESFASVKKERDELKKQCAELQQRCAELESVSKMKAQTIKRLCAKKIMSTHGAVLQQLKQIEKENSPYSPQQDSPTIEKVNDPFAGADSDTASTPKEVTPPASPSFMIGDTEWEEIYPVKLGRS